MKSKQIQLPASCGKRQLLLVSTIRLIGLLSLLFFCQQKVHGQSSLVGGYVINSDQTIYPGTVPDSIICSGASGGSCNNVYAFQWFSSTDNSNWLKITGATKQNYQPGVLNITTYYRRETYCGDEIGYTETNATINVIAPLCAGSISNGNQQIVYGKIPSTISPTQASYGNCNGNYSYQWQMSTDNIYFTDMPGEHYMSLSFNQPLAQTTYFQRKVICGGETAYTNCVKITVNVP